MNLTPDTLIKASSLPTLTQPIIYGWWRPSTFLYLYIGMSRRGLRRIYTHDVVGKAEPFQLEDEIHFWKTSLDEMPGYEKHLISFHQPKYNLAYTNHIKPPSRPLPILDNPLSPGDTVIGLGSRFTIRQVFDTDYIYMLLREIPSPNREILLTQSITDRLRPTPASHTWSL